MISKTFVFGLDGGSLDIIKEMIRDGELPTFAKIMEDGVYGKLRSTIPPITIPAWPALYTGLSPGKLGVVDHIGINENYEEDVNIPSWRNKYVWDFLGNEDFKSVVVNIPCLRKSYQMNGFLVPKFSKDTETYPPNLDIKETKPEWKPKSISGKIQVLKRNLEIKKKTVLRLIKKDWDFFTYVETITDSISHYVNDWSEVRPIYARVDDLLDAIMNETGESNLFIVSDHGIKRIKRRFFANTFLEKNGFLKTRRNTSTTLLVKVAEFIRKVFGKQALQVLKSFSPLSEGELKSATSIDMIMKGETEIFAHGARAGSFCRLWYNSKGKFNRGIVGKDDIPSLKKELREKIEDINREEDVIESIHDGRDIYGKKTVWIPDLILELSENCIEDYTIGSEIITDDIGFAHSLNGVFMGHGPEIKSNCEDWEDFNLLDITPTILHLFRIPVPENMEGRVLKEIFEKGSEPAERDIKYQKSREKERIRKKISQIKTKKDV